MTTTLHPIGVKIRRIASCPDIWSVLATPLRTCRNLLVVCSQAELTEHGKSIVLLILTPMTLHPPSPWRALRTALAGRAAALLICTGASCSMSAASRSAMPKDWKMRMHSPSV